MTDLVEKIENIRDVFVGEAKAHEYAFNRAGLRNPTDYKWHRGGFMRCKHIVRELNALITEAKQ